MVLLAHGLPRVQELFEARKPKGQAVLAEISGTLQIGGDKTSKTLTIHDQEGNIREYTVKSGDSLWLIAQRFGTTVDAIKQLNGITSNLLNVGQVLKIPSSQSSPYIEYTVRSGDTLWLLSRRYDTTVNAIKQLNGLTSDMLSIGQVLRIPTP